jgi:hypothetical protein
MTTFYQHPVAALHFHPSLSPHTRLFGEAEGHRAATPRRRRILLLHSTLEVERWTFPFILSPNETACFDFECPHIRRLIGCDDSEGSAGFFRKDAFPEWIQMGNFPGIPNRCAPYFRKSGV